MGKSLSEVLTIVDLASYLRIPKSTLYKLVREGGIPCQKIGRHWRFRKETIDSWLAKSNSSSESGKHLKSSKANSPRAPYNGK